MPVDNLSMSCLKPTTYEQPGPYRQFMNTVVNKLSTMPSTSCSHFGSCSGCTLNKQLESPPIWQEVLDFLGPSQLVVDQLYGWRTKAKLAIRGRWQNPKIGLFRCGTHEVEPISDCLAHHPSINLAVKILQEAICEEKIFIYDEKKGLLRYAQFFVELSTNKVQLALVVQSQDPSLDRLCASLLNSSLWHSIWLNVQPERNNRVLGDQWIHLWGERFLWQELDGQRFPFHPGAFSQAHWTLFEKLAKQVVEWVPNGAKLLEIYAGVGIMGMLAAHKCAHVGLVENNPCSHLSFEEKKVSIKYHFSDAKSAIEHLPQTDCLIIDPPRKGIDPLLLQAIQIWTGTLIYVSCDFHSFARDVTCLKESGWELKESKGYLLFPGTNHVEIVAKYEPRPKGRGMIGEEFRTPPKFGCEIPGPEGPGFWRPDERS